MECNKDEAVRARQIAEKKLENNDFDGAREFALKAHNVYPELENIEQLLSICDVHCSAQKFVLGSEKDRYGILQVEQFADESTVKKQYRRLARLLHPDKNRFPGAESAFKLICEANAVLSDPKKKSLHDRKIRVSFKHSAANPTPRHMNGCPLNNVYNGFSSLNQHQATQPNPSVRLDVYCTSCPFCSMKHVFHRTTVNTQQRCHKCRKEFMGVEMSAQGIPMGVPKWTPQSSTQQVPAKSRVSKSAGSQAKGVPNHGKSTMGPQNNNQSSASHMGSHSSASMKTVRPEPSVQGESLYTDIQLGNATKLSGDLKAKQTDNCAMEHEDGTCNGFANRREKDWKNNKRKKQRKHVVEDRESFDTSSDSDIEDVTNYNAATNRTSGHAHSPRRSSQKMSNVTYNEGGDDDDDDLATFPKRSAGSPEDKENGQNNAMDGMHPKDETAEGSKTGSDDIESIHSEEGYRVKDGDHDAPTQECVDCDDPEFCDFDKDRDESCFAANQFWACYDDVDGMPRFYAKVKTVCKDPFEVSFTWLEVKPIGEAQKKWVQEQLPVGCGSFKLGKAHKTSARMTFSHQVHCEKTKNRGFFIYPRKGEVWGLYKDWDLSWSSNPENHREYKYEVVEVLSDFSEDTGIKVCYVDKIGGFVSLFQRSSPSELDSFLIGPDEIYRFSHSIPSSKMTGFEREGVPKGSFELDPAALPPKPDGLYYPGKAEMGTEIGGPRKPALEKVNFVKSGISTPKEFVNWSGHSRDPKQYTVEGSKPESEEIESIHSEEGYGDKDGDHDALTVESVYCDGPEFCDFGKDRDENCFAANQFWACYDDIDGMPRFYAKVNKVCKAPFEVSFTWLDAKPMGEAQKKWIDEQLPVGCGSFNLGKTLKTSARLIFSHQVHCEKSKNRDIIIYPRKGEVWGLYKDWDLNWSSNPENHREYKYEVAEVLSDFVEDTGIKVCYLDKIRGFVSLFQRSSPREVDSFMIRPNEIYRFSHCIPYSIMSGSEREGVPVGSFELDPAALPLKSDDLYYPGKAWMGTEKCAITEVDGYRLRRVYL